MKMLHGTHRNIPSYLYYEYSDIRMAGSEQVDQLVSITGVDREMAANLLETCGGNH